MFDRTSSFDLEYKDGAIEFEVPRYYVKPLQLSEKDEVKERRHQVRSRLYDRSIGVLVT